MNPLRGSQDGYDVLTPGISKALNGKIAKELSLHDLASSDLEEVMQGVICRANF